MKKTKVITFGTFDVFHIGHLNILERCSALADTLVVGISSDELNYKKKNRYPLYKQEDRMKIIQSLSCVHEVFIEESLEKKRDYIQFYGADVLAMGDDWKGRFDQFSDICEVVYFPRTPSISTTEIIELAKGI